MEQKIIDEFGEKTSLSAAFLKCFDHSLVKEATKLAWNLARLGIDLDQSKPFDQNVRYVIFIFGSDIFLTFLWFQ